MPPTATAAADEALAVEVVLERVDCGLDGVVVEAVTAGAERRLREGRFVVPV
jgi:hypothetical protein